MIGRKNQQDGVGAMCLGYLDCSRCNRWRSIASERLQNV